LRIYKDAQVGKDASGRLIYKNENNNNRLQFNPQVGKWCIGSSCTGGVVGWWGGGVVQIMMFCKS